MKNNAKVIAVIALAAIVGLGVSAEVPFFITPGGFSIDEPLVPQPATSTDWGFFANRTSGTLDIVGEEFRFIPASNDEYRDPVLVLRRDGSASLSGNFDAKVLDASQISIGDITRLFRDKFELESGFRFAPENGEELVYDATAGWGIMRVPTTGEPYLDPLVTRSTDNAGSDSALKPENGEELTYNATDGWGIMRLLSTGEPYFDALVTRSTDRVSGGSSGSGGFWSNSGSDIYYNLGRVGVGTGTPAARFHIEGAVDETQALVRGNSTQTFDIFDVQNSASTSLFSVSSTDGASVRGTSTDAVAGTELIVSVSDRDFSSDSGNWTGTNWSIAGGVATHSLPGTNSYTLSNTALSVAPVATNTYVIAFTVNTTTAGMITMSLGGANGQALGQVVASTPQTQVIIATGTGALTFTPDASWLGDIDNISVVQITNSRPLLIMLNDDGTLGIEVRSGGSGLNNMFFGVNSGQSNTTGYNNYSFGKFSLRSNTTGRWNIGIGSNTLMSNTSGYKNIAIGDSNLTANTTGRWNTAIGFNTLKSNVTGEDNVGLGDYALNANTTGSSNTSIGLNTLEYSTTGNSNTAIGAYSLRQNTVGTSNIGVGQSAMWSNSTGIENIGIGRNSLVFNTSGSSNVGIGHHAGQGAAGLSDVSNNTFIGYDAASGIRTGGDNNVFVGYRVADSTTTGSNNIAIGYDIDMQNSSDSNKLNIGNLLFGTGIDGVGTALSTGNIGIGIATPQSLMSIETPLNATRKYLQIDVESGVPPAGDCDSDTEAGRMFVETSGGTGAYVLYVCTGAADGWDTMTLTD